MSVRPPVSPAVPPAIELLDVTAAYGRIEVLHGVSFKVEPGTVFALLGPNGAGKSTTLKVASGRVVPTGGCVHVAGTHVNGAKPHKLARAGVCSIPEGRGIFPNLTVAENLRMMTYRGEVGPDAVEEQAYNRFPVLGERRTQLAGTLSGGEQQMLAMARALTTDPSLLLLDEISMGLAPMIVGRLYELVGQLASEGISILVVEQFARTALAIADAAAIMVQGRIIRSGRPDEVTDDVSAAYLGTAS
jgi:branched-chain amino acid transport system ATP-binding protein